MGTGCISTPKIFNQCSDNQKISSNCVLYQGEAVPILGICTGDTLTEVETAILNSLSNSLEAINVNITDVNLNNCAEIADMLNGVDKNVATLFNAIISYSCSLKTLINNYANSQSFTIDLKCITASDSSKLSSIVQGLINFSCNLQTELDNIVDTINDNAIIADIAGDQLKSSINSCGNNYGITKTGSGSDVNISLYGFTIPFGMLPFWGPLEWFDNTGRGLSTTPACGWYLCNGNNGTPDMRGFAAIGAIQSMGGGTLDPLTDPVANSDSSMNYSVGSKGGKATVSLIANQNGPHTHIVSDPGHKHGYLVGYKITNSDKGGAPDFVAQQAGVTDLAYTGITINSSGAGAPIENRMPYKAFAWVTYKLNN